MTRSIKVRNGNSSTVLEAEFFEALRDIADETGETVEAMLNRIKAGSDMERRNFASSVRVFVIEHYRSKVRR